MPKGTMANVLPEDLNYESWKAECLSKVVTWKYTKNSWWYWQPLAVKKQPPQFVNAREEAFIAHGFDADGRLLLSDFAKQSGLKGTGNFIRYRSDAAYYGGFNDGRLKQYHKHVLRDGKVVESHVLGGENVEEERLCVRYYTYDGENLSKIRCEYPNGKADESTYDADGNCTGSWRIKPNGERVSLESKPLPKGVNLKSLTADIRQRLPKLVQQTVAAAKITEPVYCLALAYDGEGNGVMPPCLGIGIDSERQSWIQEHGEKAPWFIWNPAEFKHYEKDHTQFDDDDFDQRCEWYNELMADRDNEAPAIKLLNEVAAELATVNWSKAIKTTPDFVVYAVDFEMGDLTKNMKKSVAPALLTKLKTAKLL